MKVSKMITGFLFVMASGSTLADGGNYWEQHPPMHQNPLTLRTMPNASEMGHTAAQHKRWQLENINDAKLSSRHMPWATSEHHTKTAHSAYEYQRLQFGSNR
ncbi:MAG: hypothetical protein H6999_01235 [Hahellaceae bacterium]|nr:hypothetical protein [Hahellaceae bacterium]MCP5168375.1 hypothetical protein [Hahellaceae bacterium]